MRIPASWCGIVGMKPTWGLVPYTGIIGMSEDFDTAGPMTRNVRDNALLLEAIAGPDGLDGRQPPLMPAENLRFSSQLDVFFAHQPADKPLTGIRIGVLTEAFPAHITDPNVATAVRSAIAHLDGLGATVAELSLPPHSPEVVGAVSEVRDILEVVNNMFGPIMGTKTTQLTDRMEHVFRPSRPHPTMSQAEWDELGSDGQFKVLSWLHLTEKYDARLAAKLTKLLVRRVARVYDEVLGAGPWARDAARFDVLVMPTTPFPAPPIVPTDAPPASFKDYAVAGYNTMLFNQTGHPALSVPVGFVPSRDEAKVALPVGMQIVARRWNDLMCYKVAAAWEKAKDWKSLRFGL